MLPSFSFSNFENFRESPSKNSQKYIALILTSNFENVWGLPSSNSRNQTLLSFSKILEIWEWEWGFSKILEFFYWVIVCKGIIRLGVVGALTMIEDIHWYLISSYSLGFLMHLYGCSWNLSFCTFRFESVTLPLRLVNICTKRGFSRSSFSKNVPSFSFSNFENFRGLTLPILKPRSCPHSPKPPKFENENENSRGLRSRLPP